MSSSCKQTIDTLPKLLNVATDKIFTQKQNIPRQSPNSTTTTSASTSTNGIQVDSIPPKLNVGIKKLDQPKQIIPQQSSNSTNTTFAPNSNDRIVKIIKEKILNQPIKSAASLTSPKKPNSQSTKSRSISESFSSASSLNETSDDSDIDSDDDLSQSSKSSMLKSFSLETSSLNGTLNVSDDILLQDLFEKIKIAEQNLSDIQCDVLRAKWEASPVSRVHVWAFEDHLTTVKNIAESLEIKKIKKSFGRVAKKQDLVEGISESSKSIDLTQIVVANVAELNVRIDAIKNVLSILHSMRGRSGGYEISCEDELACAESLWLTQRARKLQSLSSTLHWFKEQVILLKRFRVKVALSIVCTPVKRREYIPAMYLQYLLAINQHIQTCETCIRDFELRIYLLNNIDTTVTFNPSFPKFELKGEEICLNIDPPQLRALVAAEGSKTYENLWKKIKSLVAAKEKATASQSIKTANQNAGNGPASNRENISSNTGPASQICGHTNKPLRKVATEKKVCSKLSTDLRPGASNPSPVKFSTESALVSKHQTPVKGSAKQTNPKEQCPPKESSPNKQCQLKQNILNKQFLLKQNIPKKHCLLKQNSPNKQCPSKQTGLKEHRLPKQNSPNKHCPPKESSLGKQCLLKQNSPNKQCPPKQTSPKGQCPPNQSSLSTQCPLQQNSLNKQCLPNENIPNKQCPPKENSLNKQCLPKENSLKEQCPIEKNLTNLDSNQMMKDDDERPLIFRKRKRRNQTPVSSNSLLKKPHLSVQNDQIIPDLSQNQGCSDHLKNLTVRMDISVEEKSDSTQVKIPDKEKADSTQVKNSMTNNVEKVRF